MNIKNNKLFAYCASGVVAFSLCGCSNKDDSPIVSSDTELPVSATTSVIPVITTVTTSSSATSFDSTTADDRMYSNYSSFSESTTEYNTTYSDTALTDVISSSTNGDVVIYTENDEIVLDYFSNLGNNIRNIVDTDELLAKGKAYFVYCVDFLFYDGEIKGIKFSDMTDSARGQLLLDVTTIDSLICSKFPNYKETISEGSSSLYNKASDIIKAGSRNINDFSKEKLGQENYDKLREYKDMFIDTAFGDFDVFKDVLDEGRQKVKSWYEGLK